MNFAGAFTALITPFSEGKVDFKSYENIVNFQIQNGIHGLVPSGSTGESVCLSSDEKKDIVKLTVEISKNRVPVIAGVGSNNTQESVLLSQDAQKAGANAVMAVVPYYNKPSENGIYQHFKTISENIDIPLMVYNVPSRTNLDLKNHLIQRIAEIPNVFAIKDASGDVSRVTEYKKIKSNLIQFCGEDNLICEYYKLGGDGSISVVSNALPKEWAEIYNFFVQGDSSYKDYFQKSLTLLKVLSCDSNPVPIKYVMSRLGFCKEEYRLPLVPLSEDNKVKINQVLKKLNLL